MRGEEGAEGNFFEFLLCGNIGSATRFLSERSALKRGLLPRRFFCIRYKFVSFDI